VGEKRDTCTVLWAILRERSAIHFETVPSFVTAKDRLPRQLPCDVACMHSIMMLYSNMETPEGRENKSNVNIRSRAEHWLCCQVQCYPVRQSRR
jgi:hypothetical protein